MQSKNWEPLVLVCYPTTGAITGGNTWWRKTDGLVTIYTADMAVVTHASLVLALVLVVPHQLPWERNVQAILSSSQQYWKANRNIHSSQLAM
jgi:hypothetical protein